MKKTLTANISGTVFHIEEDAYEKLQRYLGNIRAQFTGTEGRDEIMADIEARIAELFTERLSGRNVVGMPDVDHVMAIMGQPEDFSDGEEAGSEEAYTTVPPSSRSKRFFRDPDDKWIGGVMGGIGAYIGVDPLWLRIAMIVLVWASVGSLIPLYILLWILVPTADNAAERLQMRGEDVTVENIKRVVEEGASRVKEGGARMAEEAKDIGKGWRAHGNRRKSQAAEVFTKLIGIVFLIIAFSLMLGLITGMIGGTVSLWHATWSSEDMGLLDLGELLFNSREHALWFGIGVFSLLVIPVLGMFLTGFRLLLNTRTPKWLWLSLIVLWCAAWIPTMWAAADLAKDFKRENQTVTEIELVQPPSGTLYLDALDAKEMAGDWSLNFDDGDLEVDLDGLHLENGSVYGAWGQLDVERSVDTLFHLKVRREAHGSSAKAALARAEGIQYSYSQEEEVLFVSPIVRYEAANKFRGQDVQFTLEVPVGKSVFLRPGCKAVIYDIDNVTNTLDRHMLGRTWTMTERGLEDPSSPAPRKDNSWGEEAPAPRDTVKTNGPIAAVVWRGPSKKAASSGSAGTARPQRSVSEDRDVVAPARSNTTSLIPNLIGLMLERMRTI
jgi:phage shock protein PspC (stress-responsive transcriptional regulator)